MTAVERRSHKRYGSVAEHAIVSAKVRPGHDVALIDASMAGMSIETERRLLPGAAIELTLATSTAHLSARGRVLRSSVARLCADRVVYRGAIGLDRHLPWLQEGADPIGYPIPGPDLRPGRGESRPPSPPIVG